MAIGLGPSQVKAFNSATHIYIADHVFPFASDKIDLYYGSIAPDLSIYIPYDATWPLDEAFMDTHYYSVDLPYGWWKPTPKDFPKGWKTHNEIWGADFYGHGPLYHRNPDGSYTVTGYDGYVIKRAEELISWASSEYLFDLDPGLAHFAVEVAIDLLLLKNDDPDLGYKLLWAASYPSPEDMILLSLVFSEHLQTLNEGESIFRVLVINYATALISPEDSRMEALGILGAEIAAGMEVEIDSLMVQEILKKAISLCDQTGDAYYMNIITEAINGISKEKTHPRHKKSGL
jgi:hypothetical protein